MRFKRWFWRPPRVHGHLILDRRVTNLELFYDLIYVVVIGQATSRLATNISPANVVDFAIVFSLIWIAWVNGSIYLELHGNEDGRTRSLVFVQMGILSVLAVYTAQAGSATGQAFAFIYAAFLAVMTWEWLMVRREDARHRPEFVPTTTRYVVLMAVSVVVIVASGFVADDVRLGIWAAFTAGWAVVLLVLGRTRTVGLPTAVAPTDSIVERFGLFTIIVLGEFVFDVVEGLSNAERDPLTVVTGVLGLGIGFGLWWIYFDVVGHRLPREQSVLGWVLAHLPITVAIASAGAAMVSLIEHAHDGATPQATGLLLAGAVALLLVALIVASRLLADAERLPAVYKPMSVAFAVAAVIALGIGWLQPAPLILVVAIGAIFTVLWLIVVGLFIRADAWGPVEGG